MSFGSLKLQKHVSAPICNTYVQIAEAILTFAIWQRCNERVIQACYASRVFFMVFVF